MKWNKSFLGTISVVGGTGEIRIPTTGQSNLSKIAIQVPNHSSSITYSFDIVDDDGFGITGRTGLSGDNTIADNSLCPGPLNLTISQASQDGNYLLKVYFYENQYG